MIAQRTVKNVHMKLHQYLIISDLQQCSILKTKWIMYKFTILLLIWKCNVFWQRHYFMLEMFTLSTVNLSLSHQLPFSFIFHFYLNTTVLIIELNKIIISLTNNRKLLYAYIYTYTQTHVWYTYIQIFSFVLN